MRVGEPSRRGGTSARRARPTARRWPALPGSVEARRGLEAACAPPPDPVQAGVTPLEAGQSRGGAPSSPTRGDGATTRRRSAGGDLPATSWGRTPPPSRCSSPRGRPGAHRVGVVLPRPRSPSRRGDGDRASRLFDQAGRAIGLEDAARAARPYGAAGRPRRLLCAGGAGLRHQRRAPARRRATTLPGPDGSVGLTLLALVRPWGTSGPYLRVDVQLSKQFTLTQFDLIGGAAALGFRLLGPDGSLTGEYAYAYQALDGRGYLARPPLFLGGSLLTGTAPLGGAYAAHFETYRWERSERSIRSAAGAGARHRALPARGASPHGRLGRDAGTQRGVDPLSYLEHGPLARAALGQWPVSRSGARGAVAWRDYRAEDPS